MVLECTDTQDAQAVCIICLQEQPSGITCTSSNKKHYICEADLEIWLREYCSKQKEIPQKQNMKLVCPIKECSATYQDTALARHVSEESFEMYMTAAREVLELAAMHKSQDVLQAELERLRRDFAAGEEQKISQKLFAQQLLQNIPDARQCPSCSFGPVDPGDGCEDMIAHDGQLVENRVCGQDGSRIAPLLAKVRNACPACGERPSHKWEWPSWDGRLPPTSITAASADEAPAPAPVPHDSPAGMGATDRCTPRADSRPRLLYFGARNHAENFRAEQDSTPRGSLAVRDAEEDSTVFTPFGFGVEEAWSRSQARREATRRRSPTPSARHSERWAPSAEYDERRYLRARCDGRDRSPAHRRRQWAPVRHGEGRRRPASRRDSPVRRGEPRRSPAFRGERWGSPARREALRWHSPARQEALRWRSPAW